MGVKERIFLIQCSLPAHLIYSPEPSDPSARHQLLSCLEGKEFQAQLAVFSPRAVLSQYSIRALGFIL